MTSQTTQSLQVMPMSDLERGLRRCLANLDRIDAIMAELRAIPVAD
jgi:hypothetical protein